VTGELVRRDDTDSWVEVLGAVGDLASKISTTAFVPDEMRGNQAAVAAAILTGRELGVGPMTSLQHIHVIKGKPGLSAQLMRSLILSAGHELRYGDTSDTRCVVEGRRRGETEWTKVTFTADQAKRAKINLGDYPEDKLVARATSRLARRLFADAIGGLAYTVEELEDADQGQATASAAPSTRTARRATRQAEPAPQVEQAAPVAAPPVGDQPPLDDEPPTAPDTITKPQSQKLHALFNECAWTEREDRLRASSAIIGRPLTTSNELTVAEASSIIEVLTACVASPDPAVRLSEIVAMAEADADVVDGEIVDEPTP
jgi:hypothetical protein